MELTLDQALAQGVAAHREGRLHDADRFYRAVLKSQPNNPAANHNLGLLAVSFGEPHDAISLFKLAVDTSPQTEQFWLSYLDVLLTLQRVHQAEQVLEDARKAGVSSEKLRVLYEQIQRASKRSNKNARLGSSLSEKRKRLADKKRRKKNRKQAASSRDALIQDRITSLIEHYHAGRFSEGEKLALSLTTEFPKHPLGWKVLGAIFKQTGRLSESLVPMQKSVTLLPQDAEARNNLGIILQELGSLDRAEASYRQAIALQPGYAEAHGNLGTALAALDRLDEAEASYRQAVALKSDYAEAFNNLGNVLTEQHKIEDAEASYRRAVVLKPDYVEAHGNLGVALKTLGRLDEAEESYRQAIALQPAYAEAHGNLGSLLRAAGRDSEALASLLEAIALKPDFAEAYQNLGLTLRHIRFTAASPQLYPAFQKLLTAGNFARPDYAAGALVSLLKHDPLFKHLLLRCSDEMALEEGISLIESLREVPVLHHLMRVCRLPDLELERLFVTLRRFVLTNLDNLEASLELVHFLSTLSLHCFVNEFIYAESEEEVWLIAELEEKLKQAGTPLGQIKLLKILSLASYRPLWNYDWSEDLQALDQLPEVRRRLIEEPRAEKSLAQNIHALQEVADRVSVEVKAQYEKNPYPRWVKSSMHVKANSIAKVCDGSNLSLHSQAIKDVTAPNILIAGCGTGQHSIETATRFSGSSVTAIDLSFASLAYAKRKTIELGVTNLEYLQADILQLHHLGQEFDIIETMGVLHHMDDPMAGWRVLTDLLKRGGLMRVGLYSELARQHIAKIREEIALPRSEMTEADIREFRRSLLESRDENCAALVMSSDFFSLSDFRDLVLHVQEHRFTLPKIQRSLDELGLKFCGFDETHILRGFRAFLGEEADAYDLSFWHQFEEAFPSTFEGMYQFWCQKI